VGSELPNFRIVVMGTSTGGPLAVREIISALPANFPLPILLVQHLEAAFDQSYADWLQESTGLKVGLARGGPLPGPGTLSVAPVGTHLKIDGNELVLDDGPEVFNQKPAVDVLFSSATTFGKRVLAVLLTGMGRDGAQGCLEIRQHGGYTLVQDQASSAIFGMPRAAIELQAASEILSLSNFAKRMVALVQEGA
jgi:two-component system chemotaxis response regulator CheB